MKLSLLLRSLTSVNNLTLFIQAATGEISNYLNLERKRGASMPIQLFEDCSGQFGTAELNVLIDAYLSGALGAGEFSYVLDALSLAQKVNFSSPEIRNLVLDLSDEPSNKELILGVRKKINARS